MKTHIAVVLDASGSMNKIANDTIGGYNRYLQEQQSAALPGDTWTLTLFNDVSRSVITASPIVYVPELSPETYRPMLGTALYDAVMMSIRQLEQLVDQDDRVLFVVITDGEENSSKVARKEETEKLIADKTALGNWTFVYLGADPSGWRKDADALSAHQTQNTRQFAADPAGAAMAWNTVAEGTNVYRAGTDLQTKDFFAKK